MADSTKTLEIHSLLQKRWSPKGFDPTPIPQEDLKLLFEAARWSPSSFNEQPWRFVYVRHGDSAFDNLLSCLSQNNQKWARNAPVLVVCVSKPQFAYKDKPNRHYRYDLGQAVAHLTVQATAMDYYVHQMAGFDPEKAEQILDIPEPFEAITIFAVGRHSTDYLQDSVAERNPKDRSRVPLEELVFKNSWDSNHDL